MTNSDMRVMKLLVGMPMIFGMGLWGLSMCSNAHGQQTTSTLCWKEGAYRVCRERDTTPTPVLRGRDTGQRETITRCWKQGSEERCESKTYQR
jgi:hypothetical protein